MIRDRWTIGVSNSYVSKSIQRKITKSRITVKLRKFLISATHMASQNWQTIFKNNNNESVRWRGFGPVLTSRISLWVGWSRCVQKFVLSVVHRLLPCTSSLVFFRDEVNQLPLAPWAYVIDHQHDFLRLNVRGRRIPLWPMRILPGKLQTPSCPNEVASYARPDDTKHKSINDLQTDFEVPMQCIFQHFKTLH